MDVMRDEWLVDAVAKLAHRGDNVASLDLHLRALAAAKNGDMHASSYAFVGAREWESDHGYADAALHTAHQMALTANFGGDLTKLNDYYRETTRTLKKMRNHKGLALCLRSIGEIALVVANSADAQRAWELSEQFFAKTSAREADQIAVWRAVIARLLALSPPDVE